MQFQSDAPHVYTRHITPGEQSSLQALTEIVKPHTRVLDLGCGTGALGKWLSQHKQCVVDGLTLSPEEATLASPHYRLVLVGNLESADVSELFAGHQYDYIVCADVLEHLTHPERVVDLCHQMLAPGGQLLVSAPNAAYCGLVAELMNGRFDYREEGLLDRTHLRFYTRLTLLEFLAAHRWLPTEVRSIQRAVPDSEFRVAFDLLPPAVSRFLLCMPDAMSYQFVVACNPCQEAKTVPLHLLESAAQAHQPLFTAELFLGDADGYRQHQKLTARGAIGVGHQTLRFDIPGRQGGWKALRFDPADRPGFIQLHSMRLLDAQKTPVWQWSMETAPHSPMCTGQAPHQQIHWPTPDATARFQTLILLGEDPWLELPLSSHELADFTQTPVCLEIDISWPMSADHFVLAKALVDSEKQKVFMSEQLHGRLQAQEVLHNQLQSRFEHESELLQNQNQTLKQDASRWQAKSERLELEHQALQSAQEKLLTELQHTTLALQQLQGHLQWIENSTVFRATRPLVRLKMALTGQRAANAERTQIQVTDRRIEPQNHPVDVIVPVYKGLEDTQRCITSALASSNNTLMRLVVINDASPDPAVTQWLRHIATTDVRIVLLENEENLGFVGTVNRGMALSNSNDVLLLNSDTEVANNWLDRLRNAAYCDARVASVTPFSNNATICSYPRFCAANPLVDGHTTASLDALCAATNAGVAVDVPTGVGFCMYIRRSCLDEIGLFDVPNFGKGYGEENDFCRRAHAAGWRNLHALDTFVLHAGGVSFGDSKSARELAAMETLRRLYPDYEAEVMRFIQLDPAQPHRHALDLARLKQSALPKVLAVTHNRAGGTLRHVNELGHTLQKQAQFLVLSPAPGGRSVLELLGTHEAFKLEFDMDTEFEDLVHLLRAIDTSLVHFHHLLGHNPRVQALPDQLGVPFDFTAHDHYSHCPQISLTNATNRYCGETGVAQCNNCLQQSPAPGGVDIDTWRSNHRRFLQGTRFILAPSQDTAQRMQRFLPSAQVRLAPHTDMPSKPPEASPPLKAAGSPLKIVIIGALSTIKGADLLEEVAVLAHQSKASVEFHLVGYAYRNLKTRPRSHLTVHGEYTEAELPGMLEWLQPDVVWFPALWPETYSYTLSACLQAGLPVVAPDLGAFPERLAHRAWSWIQPWDMPAANWLAFFQRIHAEHFATGTPPGAPIGHAQQPTLPSGWDYTLHYLPSTRSQPSPCPPLPAATWLHAHRAGQPQPGLQGVGTGLRRKALSGLVRLRSAPGLRNVAQAIPLRWQTRIKSWLVR